MDKPGIGLPDPFGRTPRHAKLRIIHVPARNELRPDSLHRLLRIEEFEVRFAIFEAKQSLQDLGSRIDPGARVQYIS